MKSYCPVPTCHWTLTSIGPVFWWCSAQKAGWSQLMCSSILTHNSREGPPSGFSDIMAWFKPCYLHQKKLLRVSMCRVGWTSKGSLLWGRTTQASWECWHVEVSKGSHYRKKQCDFKNEINFSLHIPGQVLIVKIQRVNISALLGQLIFVSETQLCHCNNEGTHR